jgi:hypothetical protein
MFHPDIVEYTDVALVHTYISLQGLLWVCFSPCFARHGIIAVKRQVSKR